jgi:hypothetical protein
MNVGKEVEDSVVVSLGCAVGSIVNVALDVGVSDGAGVCVGIAVNVKGTLVSAMESAVLSISSAERPPAHPLSGTERMVNSKNKNRDFNYISFFNRQNKTPNRDSDDSFCPPTY